MTHLKPAFVRERFPNIYRHCLKLGLDITKKAIPVVPAAHYVCGGVVTDLQGRTGCTGLWAAGEVASTGLHGANRLASNSLLEAMYFADAGAKSAARSLAALRRQLPKHSATESFPAIARATRAEKHWGTLRRLMWDKVGIIRSGAELRVVVTQLQRLLKGANHRYRTRGINDDTIEYRNATQVGWLIAKSALMRRESRGLHERSDFPHTDDIHFRHDTILQRQ